MTLEQRKEIAMEARRQGYNCAQSVMMAFEDVLGVDTEKCAMLGAGLGSGIGGQGEVCGALLGISITEGALHPATAQSKAEAAKQVKRLSEAFRERHSSMHCRDLKGKEGAVPCNTLISNAIEIFQKRLDNLSLECSEN